MTTDADTTPPDDQAPSAGLVKVNAGVNIDLGIGELLGQILGYPAKQAGGILGDLLGAVRFELAVLLLRRARSKLTAAGVEVASLPPADLSRLLPILEWGSVASDEALQDKWANLLSSALIDPDGVPPSYPDILRQLTPREAAILDGIYDEAGDTWEESAYEPEMFAKRKGFSGSAVVLSVENLLRLWLVKYRPTWDGVAGTETKVILTNLGHDFVTACRPPGTP